MNKKLPQLCSENICLHVYCEVLADAANALSHPTHEQEAPAPLKHFIYLRAHSEVLAEVPIPSSQSVEVFSPVGKEPEVEALAMPILEGGAIDGTDTEPEGAKLFAPEADSLEGRGMPVETIDIEDSPCKRELPVAGGADNAEHFGVSQVDAEPITRQQRRILRQRTLVWGEEPSPVDEVHLGTLVSCGFSREEAVMALEACGGDPDLALEKLVDDQAREDAIQTLVDAGYGLVVAREAAKACDGDVGRALQMLEREPKQQQESEELRQRLIQQALSLDLGTESQVDVDNLSLLDLQALLRNQGGSYVDNLQTMPMDVPEAVVDVEVRIYV